MKLFKEIKRRARNVRRALRGEGVGSHPPIKVTVGKTAPVKIETFAAEQFIGLLIDEFVKPETVMECYRRDLAAKIGRELLKAGYLKEEIGQRPHELGSRGYTMRLTVRVVKNEEVE